MADSQELVKLRNLMKETTVEIVRLVKTRMEISQKIGAIKTSMKRQIEDELVEQEIQNHVQDLGANMGLDRNFIGRLLNLLLSQSVRIQLESSSSATRMNHLDMFLRAKRLEQSGKKIIHLEVGEPDFLPSTRIKLALVRAFESGKVHYTEPSGIPILKKELAKKYRQIEAQVIVTPGARFAVFSAIVSLVNPGEEIIIFEPAWPAYRQCAEFIGAKVKAIRTSLANDWNPPTEQLEKFISDNTKMIIINYPNNPTGKIIEENTFKKIVDLARIKDIIILSDEVYSEYSYKQARSVLEFGYDKAIMISSWSKSHAMTGFRIGYGISNKDIVRKMEKIQATVITSVAEPIQYAALCALKNKVIGNVNTIKRRMDFVSSRLDTMAVRYYRPDGGMYYFIQLDSDKIKTSSFIQELLDKGVSVAPGVGFGLNYEDFIRISVCQPVAALKKGLDIINSLIRKA